MYLVVIKLIQLEMSSTQEQVLKEMASLSEAEQAEVLTFVRTLKGDSIQDDSVQDDSVQDDSIQGDPDLFPDRAPDFNPDFYAFLQARAAEHAANRDKARPAHEVVAEIRERFGWK